jgi:hypothetical protein
VTAVGVSVFICVAIAGGDPDGDFPELCFIFLKAPTTGKKSACF